MDRRLRAAIGRVEEEVMAFKPGGSQATAIDTRSSVDHLNKLAENGGNGVPRIGAEAAENMLKLSTTAGADVRKLGDLAIKAAEAIRDECYQMAQDIEANGKTIATHLTGFSQLLADIGMSNRETHSRLLRGEPAPQALAPPVEQQQGHQEEEHGSKPKDC